MIFVDLAIRNLKLHPLRSSLAILGILIGVTAIAAMGILGNSIVLSVTSSLAASGNTIIVTHDTGTGGGGGGFGGGGGPPGNGGGSSSSTASRLTLAQVKEITRTVSPNVVIPVAVTSDTVSIGKKNITTRIYGLKPADAANILDGEIDQGAVMKTGSSGCLVGPTLATRNNLTIGSRLTVASGGSLRVMGILKERGLSLDISTDNAIVVTDTWFSQVYARSDYDQVIVKTNTLDEVDTVAAEITAQMNHKEKVVSVQEAKTSLAQIYNTFGTVTTFVSAIGGISLVVAGVSILNIMMMSVTERIREIGIMRSLGTQQTEVLKMFMYEALFLGVIGSAIGGALSLGVGYLVSALFLNSAAYALAPSSLIQVVYGVVFGIVISLLCGLYPAWMASRMNPIDALRHE